MRLNKIDDVRGFPECQLNYQKISFALRVLWLNTDQSCLSDNTKQLIIDSISEHQGGAFSFSRTNEIVILGAIHQDLKPKITDKWNPAVNKLFEKLGI